MALMRELGLCKDQIDQDNSDSEQNGSPKKIVEKNNSHDVSDQHFMNNAQHQ